MSEHIVGDTTARLEYNLRLAHHWTPVQVSPLQTAALAVAMIAARFIPSISPLN